MNSSRYSARLGLLAVLLALGGGAAARSATPPTVSEFPAVRLPAGAASGDLELTPCRYYLKADDRDYAADCGTLIVPENRSRADSRLIALPLIRIRALGASPAEPIFHFQGGPGSSNAVRIPTDGLLERHDLVFVGYRGLDSNVRLDCPEVAAAIAAAPGPLLGAEALAAYPQGAAACAARLQREGVDLAAYSMVETIDDMEAARQALGYARINLLGKSYGTRLEQIYLWRHPQALHRAVLVAVNPPGHFFWDARVIDAQLGDYSRLCARDAHCRARTPDLERTLRELSARLPTSWLGIPIDADTVKYLTFFALMESIAVPGNPLPLNGPAAIDLWLDAAEGDASGMALVSQAGRLAVPKLVHWGHYLAMGSSTLDYLDPRRDYASELQPAGTILGTPAARFSWALARGWPLNPARLQYNEVQRSDIETLLVSGTLDFSTPGQFSRRELLPALTRGHQVTLAEFGHTGTFWHSQDAARARLLNRFLDDGVVDASLYAYQPPVFAVALGWDTLAGWLLALATGAVLLVAALLAWALRRWRRRRAAGAC